MTAIFFVLGLLIGSFLNAVIWRINISEKIFLSFSVCPSCRKNIRWYDNIPLVSFIILRAKCRKCQGKISWQYPLMELIVGLIFAFIGANFFDSVDFSTWGITIYLLGIISIFTVIFVYDLKYMEIPVIFLWLGIFWAIAFNLYFDWGQENIKNVLDVGTYSGVLAAALSFLVFFALSVGSREKWMGLGDAYLVVFLGLVLGWPQIVTGMFISFFIGGIFSIVLLISKKKKMKSRLPLSPFLITGSFLALFWGEKIMNWYLKLINWQ